MPIPGRPVPGGQTRPAAAAVAAAKHAANYEPGVEVCGGVKCGLLESVFADRRRGLPPTVAASAAADRSHPRGAGTSPHCHSWRTAKQHPAWTKRPHRGNSPAGATRPCRAHRIPFSATGPMTIGLAALLLLEQVVFDEQRPVFIAAAGEQFGRTLLPIDDGRH